MFDWPHCSLPGDAITENSKYIHISRWCFFLSPKCQDLGNICKGNFGLYYDTDVFLSHLFHVRLANGHSSNSVKSAICRTVVCRTMWSQNFTDGSEVFFKGRIILNSPVGRSRPWKNTATPIRRLIAMSFWFASSRKSALRRMWHWAESDIRQRQIFEVEVPTTNKRSCNIREING